ncbi:MAG: histidine triad nucleotide-binding protein [Ruminococcaceae bacterium]|nr:histidine triad nucleotide-binding protein [Oscillospiraceae bacterium]
MDCLFCKIVNGDIPNNTVYEDDTVLAFYDIDPKAPVHVLVIPKQHLSGAAAVTADTAAVVGHIFEVIPQIAQKLGITDFRVVTNNGMDAGQTVGHLHFHILGGRTLGEMG